MFVWENERPVLAQTQKHRTLGADQNDRIP